MKYSAVIGALLALATAVVDAGETCTTYYASTSTSHVPTHTTSITATVTESFVFYSPQVYFTVTETLSYTYVTVKGSTTTTIPTGPSFTPIISAPTNQPTFQPQARAASPSPSPSRKPNPYPSSPSPPPPQTSASTSYPHSVECTTAISTAQTSTTTYLTGTQTETHQTTVAFHSTTHVATATAYAACRPHVNLITRYHHQPVNDFQALALRNLCGNSTGTLGQQACASPRQCCEAIQAIDADGFVWTNNSTEVDPFTGIGCFAVTEWGFSIGEPKAGTVYWIGNGPSGSGIWGSVA